MKTSRISRMLSILMILALLVGFADFSPSVTAQTVQLVSTTLYNESFTGQELDAQVSLGNASYPAADNIVVNGTTLDISPSFVIAGDQAAIMLRMPILTAGDLAGCESLVVTINIDWNQITLDNDFGVAVSDGTRAIGGMQGDGNNVKNWSLDSPDGGNLLVGENYNPAADLAYSSPQTYIISVADQTGTSTVDVANFASASVTHAGLSPLSYSNSFDFLLVGNEDPEVYGVESVSILAKAQCSPPDADGDGVPDDEDPFPNSNLDPTVNIDGCDAGVGNHWFGNGATFNDLIGEAAANAKNHGKFVSAVTKLTNEWKKAGLITGAQQGAIVSCAAQSDLP